MVASKGRTMDHPVDGLTVSKNSEEVHLFMHHTVPGIGSSRFNLDREVGLRRYTMQLSRLRELTSAGKKQLAAEHARMPEILIPEDVPEADDACRRSRAAR